MRVLLLKDVYKLGRAGDVKKVADGYGRNYLFPKGLAVLATAGALKQADKIRGAAETQRSKLNQELGGVAEKIGGLTLIFPAKAGETGKLYGSITTAMLAEALQRESGFAADKRQIDCEPIRTLGVHPARLRLTIDLVPTFSVVVHREGEPVESAYKAEVVEEAEDFGELKAALEAEEKAARAAPRGEAEGPAAGAKAEPAPAEPEAEGEIE